MSDTDMTAERPLAGVIHIDRNLEHYDWADLQNPYNYGNIFIKALREAGFRFKIGESSEDNLLGIRATKKTIDKIDEIGENLRMADVTDLYMAIDEGNLEAITAMLRLVNETEDELPIFNEDFLRRSYVRAYQRKQDRHEENPTEYPAPKAEDVKTLEEMKFVLQGRSLNHEEMTAELESIILKNITKFPYLRP